MAKSGGVTPMLFNPYTGVARDPRDIESDPGGTLLVAPGAPLVPVADGIVAADSALPGPAVLRLPVSRRPQWMYQGLVHIHVEADE